MKPFEATMQALRIKSIEHEGVIVSFSCGKDSLVVLDLCRKTFKHVVCFFLYFVPGLPMIEEQLRYARERWKVEILQYPSPTLIISLQEGVYCHPSYKFDDLIRPSFGDIYRRVMADTGYDLIATGNRATDSLFRGEISKQTRPAIFLRQSGIGINSTSGPTCSTIQSRFQMRHKTLRRLGSIWSAQTYYGFMTSTRMILKYCCDISLMPRQ